MKHILEYLLGKGKTDAGNEATIESLKKMFDDNLAREYNTNEPYGSILKILGGIIEKEESARQLISFMLRLHGEGFRLSEGLKSKYEYYYSKAFGTEVQIGDDTKLMINDHSYLSGVDTWELKLVNYEKLEIIGLFLRSNMTLKIMTLNRSNFDEFCDHVKHTQLMSGHAHDYMKTELDGKVTEDSVTDMMNILEKIL